MKELAAVVVGLAMSIFSDGKNLIVDHANQIKNEVVVSLGKIIPQGRTELFKINNYVLIVEVKEVSSSAGAKE